MRSAAKPAEDLLCFLDTETGGLEPGRDPVVEVAAAVETLGGAELGSFCAKIRLRSALDSVSAEAAAVNGYDPEVWAREARPMSDFQDWLDALVPRGHLAIPVGHNVLFDRRMLDEGYYRPWKRFCPLSYHCVDTVSLACAMRAAGALRAPDLKLGSVCAALGIENERAHSARGDMEAAREAYRRFVARIRAGSSLAQASDALRAQRERVS